METKHEASVRILKHLKATGYANEKTPFQRELRNIKRKTRWRYPLKNQFCLCGDPATEHHHTTNPITADDFIFLCHNCHYLLHYKYREGGRK